MDRRPARRPRIGGFTLIELLVAIALMALMAALSWRGLDGMTRAQTQMRQHSDDVLALQAGLAQWGADLDALAVQPNSPSLDWDGRALRILRRGTATPGEGLRVVAWSRRDGASGGQWLRWQSPPLNTRGDLQQAWQNAGLWAQNASEEARQREVRIVPLDSWQIFYYRTNAWSNPLSSAGTTSAGQVAAAPLIPDGIRLVLTLTPGQAVSGTLTRDWLRPTVGGGK
jgi:general secretion pathway protein J